MKEFWDNRYSESGYAYGDTPNEYFAKTLGKLKIGKALFPAEGEGRNAVYAAKLGWNVHAFDQSIAGKEKALSLSGEQGVKIHYEVCGFDDADYPASSFDLVVLIFAHFPPNVRSAYHAKAISWLKPGGWVILEGFSKDHLSYNSVNPRAGGPRDEAFLFSESELKEDFFDLIIHEFDELNVHLEEGKYHSGESAVIRLLAQKPIH